MGPLKMGLGRGDLTPELGRCTGGYSLCAPYGQGFWGRLQATAVWLEDGAGGSVAIVAIDLHAGSRWVAEHAARALRLPPDRLLLAGTHTHLGPGGIYGNRTYDEKTTRFGTFDVGSARRAVRAVVRAVHLAQRAAKPAELQLGEAQAFGALWNRSAGSVMWNRVPGDPGSGRDPDTLGPPPTRPGRVREVAEWIHGEPPDGMPAGPFSPAPVTRGAPSGTRGGSEPEDLLPEMTHEAYLATLRAAADERGLLQAIACKQLSGTIERSLERWLAWSRVQVLWGHAPGDPSKVRGALALVPGTPTVLGVRFGLFTPDVIGAATRAVERDRGFTVAMTANILGDVNAVSPDHTVDELLAARDDVEGVLPIALAAGDALAEAVREAHAASAPLGPVAIRTLLRHPKIAGAQFTHGGVGRALAHKARFGAETQRGGELGPGRKGLSPRTPTEFDPTEPQSPKRHWIFGGLGHAPTHPALHLVALDGDDGPAAVVCGIPGELSGGVARELTDRLRSEATSDLPVLLTGPAGGYLSYFNTALEYRLQEYESAGVPYGRWSAGWLEEHLAAMLHAPSAPPSPPPFDLEAGKPGFQKPKSVPIPSPRFERAREADEPAGLSVRRAGKVLHLSGWWTGARPHDKRFPAPGDRAWLEVALDGKPIGDDRADGGLILRLGKSRRGSRWGFFLTVTAKRSPRGKRLTVTWHGPPAGRPVPDLPTVRVPTETHGLAEAAVDPATRARDAARRPLAAAPADAARAVVAEVLRDGAVIGRGAFVGPRSVVVRARIAAGATAVRTSGGAELAVTGVRVYGDFDPWSGRGDVALLALAADGPAHARLPTWDEVAGLSTVALVGGGVETARVVWAQRKASDPGRDAAARYGVFGATELVVESAGDGVAVAAAGDATVLIGLQTRPTSEDAVATGRHGVVQRLDAYRAFVERR